jgi:hypothetical protein
MFCAISRLRTCIYCHHAFFTPYMKYPLTTYTCWIRFRCGTFSFHSSFATYYCLSNCNGNLLHRHHVNHSFCNHYGSVCAFYADNVCVVNAVCRRADAVCNLNVVCRLSDCLQTICRLSAYLMTSEHSSPRKTPSVHTTKLKLTVSYPH